MTLPTLMNLLLTCSLVCVMDGVFLHTVVLTVLACMGALFLLYLLLLACRQGHPFLEKMQNFRFAHRGLHNKAEGVPENSLAAFRLAVEKGFGAELDVHLTRDGRLAVIHDSSLLRTAGADVKVEELTAAELGQYRLEGTEEKIPLLEQVLSLFEGKAPLIIELKVEDKNHVPLVEAVCKLLEHYPGVDYCIESFHPQVLRHLATKHPKVCRGQLSENFFKEQEVKLSWPAAFVMKNLLTGFLTAPDFIAYNIKHRNRLSLKLARKAWRVQEVSWTVRTPEELALCEKAGSIPIFEGFIPEE